MCSRSKVTIIYLLPIIPQNAILSSRCSQQPTVQSPKKSAQWFSMFGPPLEIDTGNGAQYGGQPYEDMFSKWNIKYTTTSPRYPQVRTVKWIIHKCVETGDDTIIALQQHRCTSLDSNLSSPSEILFNRPIPVFEESRRVSSSSRFPRFVSRLLIHSCLTVTCVSVFCGHAYSI